MHFLVSWAIIFLTQLPMKYSNSDNFSHATPAKVGILITNLGTPDAPTPKALRRYLGEFLADPRVVEMPRWLWRIILHGIILRIRPRRSAKAYASVWQEGGSPLMIHTKAQADALSSAFKEEYGESVVVDFAMRYGSPSIASVAERLLKSGCRRLIVLPLYPQYSATTTGSTFDALADWLKKRRWLPDLRFISHYHDHPAYIQALANQVKQHWQKYGRAEKLIFSYHGIPKRYLINGDPYHCECYKTSRLLAEQLGLSEGSYLTSFQSRFGREEWLKPYTDMTLKQLARENVKSVQVLCPGFSSDCLETIEEIDEENRGYFLEAGGERFEYIPALNASESHIQALSQIIKNELSHWQQPGKKDHLLTEKEALKYGAKH